MASEWSMTTVPDFAIVEVVSRLPLKYVVRAKSVCKRWLHLITCSNKLVRHIHDFDYRRLPRKNNPFLLFWMARGRSTHKTTTTFLDLYVVDFVTWGKFYCQTTYQVPFDYKKYSWIAYTCNGILCFTNSLAHPIYLCNPTTEQTMEIPTSPAAAAFQYPSMTGLGFLPSSNQYILVRWFFPSENVPGCEILSLSDNNKTPSCSSWRSITNHHKFVRFSHDLQPINIGPVIYWLVVSLRVFKILSYLLEAEESKLISLPEIVKIPASAYINSYLVELRGYLCLGLNKSIKDTEIWSLEDTANQKWILRYKISHDIPCRVVTSYHTDDHVEELVCAQSSICDGLSYYNTKNNTIRNTGKRLGKMHNGLACMVYDNSFALSAETII